MKTTVRRAITVASLIWLMAHGAAGADSTQDQPHYWITRRTDDPRFIVSMARMSKCHLPGRAKPGNVLRVPAELYPEESIRLHEEGTVELELLFDDEWCVRKATVLESSGFFRLDEVSLQYAMHLKYTFDVKERIDGQPVIRIPIGWGASQSEKMRALLKKYPRGDATTGDAR